MSVKTKTYRGYGESWEGTCTWTIKYTFNDFTVSGSSFKLPSMNISGSYSWPGFTTASADGYADIYIVLDRISFGGTHPLSKYIDYTWNFYATRGTTGKFNKSVASDPSSAIPTSSIFNSSNKTTKKLLIKSNLVHMFLETYDSTDKKIGDEYYDGFNTYYILNNSTYEIGYITLNAPPTFTVGTMTKNTDDYYASATTVTVPISALSAKYGGDITSAKLTIGSQSVSRTTNGNLSILLSTTGTFTPTVTVTDSRGQKTTKTLSAITVKPYLKPSVSLLSSVRADSLGRTQEEGSFGLVSAKMSFLDDIVTLNAPVVTVTDTNGNVITQTTDWYTSWTNASGVSNKITDWSNFSSSPINVYALIDGNFDTGKSYVITVQVSDSKNVQSEPISQTLTTAYYTIDFLAGGQGIAFGAASTQIGFLCALPFYLSLDETAASGTDHDLYTAISVLGWSNEVIV